VLVLAVAFALAQPPPWIQRTVPGPYVTWRAADVLGTPVVEGIVVTRDRVAHSITVNVVDSRFDPSRIVKLRELQGSGVRWLRAGRRDRLARNEIAIDVVWPKGEQAYLLRVGRSLALEVVRRVHGERLEPAALRG
jgi:hypothetical protein